MLEEALSIDYNTDDIQVRHVNTDYNFEICSLKSEAYKFTLVYTRGLSSTAQMVDENNTSFKLIELFICLPEYFNLDETEWPINWLNKIAAIPQKNKTWLGIGDTIPAGNPAEPISEILKANHFIVMEPNWMCQYISPNSQISYFALVPIFQNELDFKMRNSHTILFKKFAKKQVTELVDIYRTSICRKRIFGMI